MKPGNAGAKTHYSNSHIHPLDVNADCYQIIIFKNKTNAHIVYRTLCVSFVLRLTFIYLSIKTIFCSIVNFILLKERIIIHYITPAFINDFIKSLFFYVQ